MHIYKNHLSISLIKELCLKISISLFCGKFFFDGEKFSIEAVTYRKKNVEGKIPSDFI